MSSSSSAPSSDAYAYLAYWVFASPIILANFHGEEWTLPVRLTYYGYMVVAYTASAHLSVEIIISRWRVRHGPSLVMPTLFSLLVLVSTGTYALDVWVLKTEAGWWYATWNWNLANDAQNVLTIVAILAGKRYVVERQRTLRLESERRQSELQRLRAQVDPHFLFNSLNILDILIEDRPDEARHFVHRLSNLYRYLIRHRDEDLVSAAEELQYARDYRYLVERRFGQAFRFRENFDARALDNRYLPPGALQTVLENVFKHNAGTVAQPVHIDLDLTTGTDGDTLVVTNDYRPKAVANAPQGDGTSSGLDNLHRRVSLLSDRAVTTGLEGERWRVGIPLVGEAPAASAAPPITLTVPS